MSGGHLLPTVTRLSCVVIMLDYIEGKYIHLLRIFQLSAAYISTFADTAAVFSPRLGARRRVLLTFLGMSLPLCVFEKLTPAVQNNVTIRFVPHLTLGATSGSGLTSTRMGMRSQSGPC